jgi:hypothetical protein
MTVAEKMLDKVERLLVEEKKLKDEKRILELQLQHEQEKTFNRDTITKGLANLGQVISVLPPEQRRELLRLLVSRVVVKPWDGESAGISGDSI